MDAVAVNNESNKEKINLQHSVFWNVSPSLSLTTIQKKIEEFLSETLSDNLHLSSMSCWKEVCEFPSHSDQGKDRIQREMFRSLPTNNSESLRVVLLTFSDGINSLILISHRSFLKKGDFDNLIHYCFQREFLPKSCSSQEKEVSQLKNLDRILADTDFPTPLFSGLQNKIMSESFSSKSILFNKELLLDKNHVISAVCVTASRLFAVKKTVMAVNGLNDITDDFQLFTYTYNNNLSFSDFEKSIKEEIETSTVYHRKETHDKIKNSNLDGIIPFGIVFIDQDKEIPEVTSRGYEPFLTYQYPFTLYFDNNEKDQSILKCRFCSHFFDEESVDLFLSSLLSVLLHISKKKETPVSSLPLLSDNQIEEIVHAGFNKPLEEDCQYRIDQLFETMVKEHPQREALSCDGKSLTYEELNRISDIYACTLSEKGVKAHVPVGVCMERSLDLIIVLIAIMKAGGYYVPMDEHYPDDRLDYICQNSGITVLISYKKIPSLNSAINPIHPDELKSPQNTIHSFPKRAGSCEDPAYVIYTSGSSGKPKGVMVPHKNVTSLIKSTQSEFSMNHQDVWTFFHSVAFDFSVWEIWGCLCSGGKLEIVPYWLTREPEQFHKLVKDQKVTIISQTPTAFSQFIQVESSNKSFLKDLRLVILGGEKFNTGVLSSWYDRYSENDIDIINMFGITETTVHVTYKKITRRDYLSSSNSVGIPLSGWHLYVMNENGHVQPFGVAGEIYVGGAGVASQYLGRPDLTKERFLVDPFRPGKLYRSGDKGRLLKNGELEYLGRLDNQIKLRGFRIELGEIAKVLSGISGINSAHVVLSQPNPNDPATARLDAYLTMDSPVTTDRINSEALKKLPLYMLPSTYTVLDALPLTSNGKIDNSKLPAPEKFRENTEVKSSKEYVEKPDEETVIKEEIKKGDNLIDQLIEIWQKVLGCDVSEDENFFSLGGNSLYATQIVRAVRESGLITITLMDLYTLQTIRAIVSKNT